MAPSRFVQPDSDRLELSGGDWILVKRRLNTGEYRTHMRRSARELPSGVRQLDAFLEGRSLPLAYLLDWSLVDPAGKPVVIRDQSEAAVSEILDGLDPDDFTELLRAIEAHVARQDAVRAEEKKTAGTPTSSETS